jgi:hypothetical protein
VIKGINNFDLRKNREKDQNNQRKNRSKEGGSAEEAP